MTTGYNARTGRFTMKCCFLALLVLAAAGLTQEDREAAHVGVHEWGVITWEQGSAFAQGAPCDHWEEMVARAPVVYFHGPEFHGSFTVSVDNGQFIEVYPSDGLWSTDTHTWTGDFLLDYPEDRDRWESRGLTVPSDFQWALDYWRAPETLVFSGDDGSVEDFLYYETLMDDFTFLPLYPGWDPEGAVGSDRLDVELLLLRVDDGVLVSTTCSIARFGMRQGIPLDWDGDVGADGAVILDNLYEWSRDLVDIQEVDALWNTWRDWFLSDAWRSLDGSGANAMALYLLPAEMADRVSVLELETDEGYPVDYSRYLLVAVPVTL